MKIYIFLFFVFIVVVAGAYWAGGRVASQKCATQIAEIRAEQQSVNLENMVNVQKNGDKFYLFLYAWATLSATFSNICNDDSYAAQSRAISDR